MPIVRIWNNDDGDGVFVPTKLVYLPYKIMDGPSDAKIEIVGVNPVEADENGDFLLDPKLHPDGFDAVNTFVIVRQVMIMYQRALWKIGRQKPLSWQWGTNESIKINPRAGNQPKAYYSRKDQSLQFYFFKRNGRMVYTCRSFEVVAHECAHAILDSLRPGYWSSWQLETGALHEAFADITVILATLSDMSQCEKIIRFSKANLLQKSVFDELAIDAGSALGRGTKGFRSADNDLTMYEVTEDVQDVSQVFTGAFYDILADIFQHQRNPEMKTDSETLFKVGEHMTELFVRALLGGPPQNATFKDIAEKIISIEKSSKSKSIMSHHFTKRRIIGNERVRPPTKPVEMRWGNCNCCLSKPEHVNAVEVGMRKAQSCFTFGATSP